MRVQPTDLMPAHASLCLYTVLLSSLADYDDPEDSDKDGEGNNDGDGGKDKDETDEEGGRTLSSNGAEGGGGGKVSGVGITGLNGLLILLTKLWPCLIVLVF